MTDKEQKMADRQEDRKYAPFATRPPT